MGYDDFEILGMSALDPTPDEEAWEAYLDFAHPILGGDDSRGLAADDVRRLEAVVGAAVPWEIGLFLVLGVPAGDGWWQWNDDPGARWDAWQVAVRDFAADHNVTIAASAPPLLPLFECCAVPLGFADGSDTDLGNPVVELTDGGLDVVGADLADWLHQRFDVPLPVWPPKDERTFPTWTDLLNK